MKTSTGADRPNVLFVIADDHRHDALGVCANGPLRTPTLDQLCATGTRYTHARTCGGLDQAVCIPTRASMLTGRHPFDALDQRAPGAAAATLPLHGTTLPQAFREAGYRAYAVGKWHNAIEAYVRSFDDGGAIFLRGMDDPYGIPLHAFDPQGLYPPETARRRDDRHATDLIGDAACELIERHAAEHRDRPFFMWLAMTSPHDPRTAASSFREMYDPDAVPLPAAFLPAHPFDNGDLHVRDERLAGMPRTPDEVRRHEADYFAMITQHDAMIGRVLERLKRMGQFEQTLIVYTSDHGLAVGRHGLMGKQNLYDHSIGVPLILSGPGVARGQTVAADVHSFDVGPTLCRLAGVPVPATMCEAIELPLPGESSRRPFHFGCYRFDQRSVCDGRWKLIRYFVAGGRVQLFDLATDPYELRGVADLHADHVRRLDAALIEEMHGRADGLLATRAGEPAGDVDRGVMKTTEEQSV